MLVLLALVPGGTTRAEPPPAPPQQQGQAGGRACWAGEWTAPVQGQECRFTFTLELDAESGPVRGAFAWRLVRCPGLEQRAGDRGTERVLGRIEGASVRLRGTSVSDPTLLATDQYRLTLEGDTLRGSSRTNEGDWDGHVRARRTACAARSPDR